MDAKIEKRSYSYVGNNVCTVSATLNIYIDNTIIANTNLSATYNLSQTDFMEEITRQITVQINAYLAKLIEVDNFRKAIFPNSVDFTDAVNQIFDPIEADLGGI